MEKHFIYSLAATFITVALAMGSLTACSNEDSVVDTMPGGVSSTAPVVYSVNIPAMLGDMGTTRAVAFNDITGGMESTFRTTDKITVYNTSKNCAAINKEGEYIFLHADANTKTANLVGELVFIKRDNTNYNVETGDKLLLIYNTSGSNFKYNNGRTNPDHTSGQKGTLASLSDYHYATAEVTITDISGAGTADIPYTMTTTPASFTNLQSMFKLTFTGMPNNFSSDGHYQGYDGIKKITIHSAKKKLASIYSPYNDKNTCGDLEIKLGGSGDDDIAARKANGAGNVVYAALRFLPLNETETDEITFSIQTTADDYIAKMISPVGGFQNGKYYNLTIEANPKEGG